MAFLKRRPRPVMRQEILGADGKRRVLDDEDLLESNFDGKLFTRFLRYILPYKKNMIIAILMMCIGSVCSLAGPFFIRLAIDNNIKPMNLRGLPWLCLAFLGCNCISLFCLRTRVWLMENAGRSAIATLRQDLYDHIQNLSLPFFDTRSAGKVLVRVINDINSLIGMFTDGVINVIIDAFTLVILLILMFSISVPLTLGAMCVLPVLFLFVWLIKGVMRRRWQVVRVKSSSMNGYLHESLAGMRVTQSFTREEVNSGLFHTLSTDLSRLWLRAVRINMAFFPSLDIISMLGTIVVYYLSINMIGAQTLEIGAMMAIVLYMGRFWEPMNNLANFYGSILTAMASMERIFEIIDTPIDIKNDETMPLLPPIRGAVDFDGVTFSYDDTKVVLKDVSFHVEPGQTIALVGPTGAGKSTVINLISRFYDVNDGKVMIDGHDIREVNLHSLRSQMGIMLQDTFIFSGTIMDNIRYGRLNATDEEIMEAAKIVSAHEFIVEMEHGYQTQVKERGSRLSVGQKQLISFARALLADPRILILDEATSSIDNETEQLIQQALSKLLKGRTSFVIAHRLSTIRQADCIMVIGKQGIMEKGTHTELMEQKGFYHSLVEAQYRFMEHTPSSSPESEAESLG